VRIVSRIRRRGGRTFRRTRERFISEEKNRRGERKFYGAWENQLRQGLIEKRNVDQRLTDYEPFLDPGTGPTLGEKQSIEKLA